MDRCQVFVAPRGFGTIVLTECTPESPVQVKYDRPKYIFRSDSEAVVGMAHMWVIKLPMDG